MTDGDNPERDKNARVYNIPGNDRWSVSVVDLLGTTQHGENAATLDEMYKTVAGIATVIQRKQEMTYIRVVDRMSIGPQRYRFFVPAFIYTLPGTWFHPQLQEWLLDLEKAFWYAAHFQATAADEAFGISGVGSYYAIPFLEGFGFDAQARFVLTNADMDASYERGEYDPHTYVVLGEDNTLALKHTNVYFF